MDVEKRAAWALFFVRYGELSSARMASQGSNVVPGNLAIFREVTTNPEKRFPRSKRDLSQEVVHNEPAVLSKLDQVELGLFCHRSQQVGFLVTQLMQPDGGARGIVVGEIFRRLLDQSQSMAKSVEAVVVPFQHALSTQAECECVAHILQTDIHRSGWSGHCFVH